MMCGTSDTNECMALLVVLFTFVRFDNVIDDSPPVCFDDRRSSLESECSFSLLRHLSLI